jgi:hypothetical protein
MIPRVFRIQTYEGSVFAAKFYPGIRDNGIQYGQLQIMGHSKVTNTLLSIVGMGCIPERGSSIKVSQEPVHKDHFGSEEIAIYETETIRSVEEISIPEDVLKRLEGREKQGVNE